MLLLAAFLAALSSVLARLGRHFCRPACFLLSARSNGHLAGFLATLPLPGALMSAGLRPPVFGLLVPDRSLPWPPCACVASLAAFSAAFLAAQYNGSLAALWASSLAARRASSLAAQCTASLAARCTACLATQRPGSLTAQCAACFAAQCAACFADHCVVCFTTPCAASLAARCAAGFAARRAAGFATRRAAYFAARRTACFAARHAACFAAQCATCFAVQCAACFAAQCAAYFAARGVACLAAPCAASFAVSRAAFLDTQAGPPSTSVFFPPAAPLQGSPVFCSFHGLVSPTGHLLTPFFHFSLFVPVSPSCGSLILGPSHVWPYRHGDTGTACTSTALWDLLAHGNKVYSPQTDGSAVCRYAY